MQTDTSYELTRIEEKIAKAWVDGDQEFIDAILEDDWKVIDPTGRILTKAEVLREAFTGEREITEGMVDQVNVRNFGEWAIVTGRTQMSGSYQGQEMSVILRFTDVFIRRSGAWKCVSSHGTFISE